MLHNSDHKSKPARSLSSSPYTAEGDSHLPSGFPRPPLIIFSSQSTFHLYAPTPQNPSGLPSNLLFLTTQIPKWVNKHGFFGGLRSSECYEPIFSQLKISCFRDKDDQLCKWEEEEGGGMICACVAPPQNLKPSADDFYASKFNELSNPANLRILPEEDESDVLIECRDVYKSFGEKHILRGVNLKIRQGEAVGIIGPSGTGKSTILKIIAGLLAPDKGEVLIRGKKRSGLISDDEMSGLRIGLVFQSAALFDSLTVRENVGFVLYENSRMPLDQIAELVTETLAAVGLKGVEERMPSELSGGMKKRVALARSIIFDTTKDEIEPEVILYDEPTAGLDPIASTVVEDLIRSIHSKGEHSHGKPGQVASYVVVTHQHSTIKRAVDRLLFLHEGKVVWQGMTHEFTVSTNPIVKQFASGSLDGPIKY